MVTEEFLSLCRFKKGNGVRHVNGGRGVILDIKSDRGVSPSKVVAVVEVLDTVFYDVRRVRVSDLVREGE